MNGRLRLYLDLIRWNRPAGWLLLLWPSLYALWILGLLASLYSVYLFFLGLPVLMKCPPDKAVAYTAVVAVAGFVASLIVGSIASLGAPGLHAWR